VFLKVVGLKFEGYGPTPSRVIFGTAVMAVAAWYATSSRVVATQRWLDGMEPVIATVAPAVAAVLSIRLWCVALAVTCWRRVPAVAETVKPVISPKAATSQSFA
jgi:hypothetical protein